MDVFFLIISPFKLTREAKWLLYDYIKKMKVKFIQWANGKEILITEQNYEIQCTTFPMNPFWLLLYSCRPTEIRYMTILLKINKSLKNKIKSNKNCKVQETLNKKKFKIKTELKFICLVMRFVRWSSIQKRVRNYGLLSLLPCACVWLVSQTY